MVSKEELRYGNKVIANGLYEGRIMTFQRLHDLEETIFFTEGHAGEYLKDCDGIPLTPEILEKAGLYQNITNTAWWNNEEDILLADKEDGYYLAVWVGSSDDPELETIGQPIEHLHQLQNLYFDLTNEELPITL